ncbi:hypothetical protein Tco_0678382 [Tanacetum coccineum]|uniref:Uncharacterized protein n=1 Tax=Tanacetum coccineum TaxID=301880 RepID=A0ABQ4XFV1_9ASTR
MFAKPSILGKPVLQPLRNESVVRKPTAFKSERPRISKSQFASQVDVKNDLSKPFNPHYFPKVQEYAFVKPHHVSTRKIFTSSTTKVDIESPHGSNTDITNPHECKQTLDLSAGTSINVQKEQTLNFSARTPIDKEKIKALIIENRIAGRPLSYGITLEKAIEIFERPKFQGIQNLDDGVAASL